MSITAQRINSSVLQCAICKHVRADASAHHATQTVQEHACLYSTLLICLQLVMAVKLLLLILLCLVQLCLKATILVPQLLQIIPQLTAVSICS